MNELWKEGGLGMLIFLLFIMLWELFLFKSVLEKIMGRVYKIMLSY